jgi:hypothetical protein
MLQRILYPVVSLILGGCAACPHTAHSPRLSEGEAVAIANRAAEASGANLSQFQTPEAHYEYVSKDCTWSVFYQGVKPTIGNHFLVVVNDCTRATQLSGGL